MSKYKIYILIACIVGVVIIIGGYLTTIVIRDRLNENLIDNYAANEETIAGFIAKSLEAEIRATENQLILMAEDPLISDGTKDECVAAIKKDLENTNSKLGNVGRVDKDGVFRCSINTALIGTAASKLGPYITDIFSDPEHTPVMSRVIKAPGATSLLTALHVPVWNQAGVFDGTLGGAIYLTNLQEKYLKDVIFAKRGFVVLVDDDGTILYHKRDELIGAKLDSPAFAEIIGDVNSFQAMIDSVKEGKSGIREYHSNTEETKVAGFAPVEVIPGRTWLVMVTVPVSDIETDLQAIGVHSLLQWIWILLTLVVIISEAIFILLSYRLVFKPLKEIQQMKSDFVSLVSHQLKTPVAQIKGYTENMLDGLTGPLTDKQKEYLTDMIAVANKNSKLIDDLLNISRIERGMLKTTIEPINFPLLITDVLDPLRTVAEKKGVVLSSTIPKEPIMISGDPVKTREALRNIVDNAIKFTERGRMVEVKAEDEGAVARVSVRDEGPGVDPDVQKELFEKNRVWSGKVKASGAGLGLYLSKQFIELTGGTITFSTKLGEGTTFVIKLPKIKQ